MGMARTAGSQSDITGPRIRAEALRLFARHGFAAVSMRQIAGAVGVQVGTLYNYIPDKESLLFDLMRTHMVDVLGAVRDDPDADPMDRLAHFVRFHIAFHHERPDAVFMAYMELRNLAPQNFTALEAMRQQYERHLECILRDGAAAGVFDIADPKITTLALIAMLTGVNTWFRTEGRLSLAQVQDHYLDLVRKAVSA